MVLHGDLPNIHVPVYKRMFILNIDVLVLFRFCKKKKNNINRERKLDRKCLASKDDEIIKVEKVWNDNGGWWYVYCHIISILHVVGLYLSTMHNIKKTRQEINRQKSYVHWRMTSSAKVIKCWSGTEDNSGKSLRTCSIKPSFRLTNNMQMYSAEHIKKKL